MTYQLGTHPLPPPVAVRLQVGRNGTACVPGPWAYNHHTQWLLRWAYQSWQHTVDQRANPATSSAVHWFRLLTLRSTTGVSPKGRSPPPFCLNFPWCGGWNTMSSLILSHFGSCPSLPFLSALGETLHLHTRADHIYHSYGKIPIFSKAGWLPCIGELLDAWRVHTPCTRHTLCMHV